MFRRALTLALLALLMLPAGAQDSALSPPQGALYLGPGRMLEASQPRQLSLNAHVTQLMYQPGGLGIAYVSAQPGSEGAPQSVRLVGLKRGETTTLYTYTRGAAPEGYFGVSLLGWTADARYLIVSSDEIVPAGDAPEPRIRTTSTCIDVGATPAQLRLIPSTLPPPSKSLPYADVAPRWSPSHTRLLLEESARDSHYHETARVCSIYDPAQDKTTTFVVPSGGSVQGWLGEGRLLLRSRTDTATRYFTWDLATGKQTETAPPARMPARDTGSDDSAGVSPKSPALSLDVEKRFHPDKQGVTGMDSHLLWVRRAGQLRAMSAMPIGLTPGSDAPQAVWSPNGKQIAFVDHGDLWVTDLTERDARPKEKYLAGEKLTCPEERQVAAESLKQIGLAIMQYAQDNDEKFPALKGVTGSITPYLPPDALLAVGGHPFVYRAPSDLSLAAMDAPADTVLGTIDLPCGRVALYADGHVKAAPSPPSSGTPPPSERERGQ